jgi:proton-dependent oligopeptide transporter, POT family
MNRTRFIPYRLSGAWVANGPEAGGAIEPYRDLPMTPHPSGASQARSFTTVFLIEMWERFGYYGMAALLVLFMIDKLGFADSHANLTWGAFTALVFSAPAIGGWIGDKVLGARRTMIFGACVLASGYLMLSIPFDSLGYLYAALGVIVVGNGLFKANAANLVRRIYEGDDARLDSAFTVYYMSVNIGSTISMLATPWIKDHWGWHAAFAVCFAGMVLGLINFMAMRRTVGHIGSAPDDEPMMWGRFAAVAVGGVALGLATVFVLQNEDVAAICVYAAGVAVLVIFGWMLLKCDRSERAGLLAALILTLQVILFFIFYQQMSTSLTLFALRNVDASFTLFNVTLFSWSAAQFQALNPFWIMLPSPFPRSRTRGSRIAATISPSPQSTRWVSWWSRWAFSCSRSAAVMPSMAVCRRGAWSAATGSIRLANCWCPG